MISVASAPQTMVGPRASRRPTGSFPKEYSIGFAGEGDSDGSSASFSVQSPKKPSFAKAKQPQLPGTLANMPIQPMEKEMSKSSSVSTSIDQTPPPGPPPPPPTKRDVIRSSIVSQQPSTRNSSVPGSNNMTRSSPRRNPRRSQSQSEPQRFVTPRAPKRAVSFEQLDKEGPSVVPIEHVKSLPRKEITKRWVSSKEFRTNQVEASAHLEKQTAESEGFSARGLERLTEDGTIKFLKARREGLMAVLQQQRACPKHVRQKDELIAAAYRYETKEAGSKAALRAELDAEEVADYLAEGCDTDSVRQHQMMMEGRQSSGSEGEGRGKRGIKKRLSSFFLQ